MLYARITWLTIGTVEEPLCAGQWSFWFHTERIFLHYYVTISFSIRALLHVVYDTCSYRACGHMLIIGVELGGGAFFALLGWLVGRSVVGWFVDY